MVISAVNIWSLGNKAIRQVGKNEGITLGPLTVQVANACRRLHATGVKITFRKLRDILKANGIFPGDTRIQGSIYLLRDQGYLSTSSFKPGRFVTVMYHVQPSLLELLELVEEKLRKVDFKKVK